MNQAKPPIVVDHNSFYEILEDKCNFLLKKDSIKEEIMTKKSGKVRISVFLPVNFCEPVKTTNL